MLVSCCYCGNKVERSNVQPRVTCFPCRRKNMNAYSARNREKIRAIRNKVNGIADKIFKKEATKRAKSVAFTPKPTKIRAKPPKPMQKESKPAHLKYEYIQIDTDINKGKSYAEYRKESKRKVQDNKANRIARLKMEKAEREAARGCKLLDLCPKTINDQPISVPFRHPNY